MRVRAYFGQTIIGLAILALTLGALGWVIRPVVFPLVLLAMVGINVFAILQFLWIAAIAALIVCGIFLNKPGLILAPAIFHLGWFIASVANQRQFLANLDPKVWNGTISPEARSQRTLIADSYKIVDRKIIADGHADKLVGVKRNGSTHKITDIEEVSLAKGEDCSVEEKQASAQLQNAGRTNECFKSRHLDDIPDGLVIEEFSRLEDGCCSETQARLRIGGQERLLFSWFQGVGHTLSRFPQFYWTGGPFMERERFGLEDISSLTMESAIYGVIPPYRWDSDRGRPTRPPISMQEALDRARSLSRLSDADPKTIVSLLKTAGDKGLADGLSLDVAASLVGHGSEGWHALMDYLPSLNTEQTTDLLEKIIRRLETPNICSDCVASGRVREWKLLRDKSLSHSDEFSDRVKRIFVQRSDLAAWQYEGCLRILVALGPPHPASDNFVAKVILPALLADDSQAYSDKAIAYLIVVHKGFQSSDIWPIAAEKLGLVNDQDLKQYISGFWGFYLSSRSNNPTREQVSQLAKVCERISRISDPSFRNQKFPVDCSAGKEFQVR
jgi:hypothetical protein